MNSRLLMVFLALLAMGLPFASSLAQGLDTDASPEPSRERASAFYFPGELGEAANQPVVTVLHAGAIQTGATGDARVWINGRALKIDDRIGPVRITGINALTAEIEVLQSGGQVQNLALALNQSLTLRSEDGSIEVVGIREGVGAVLANTLRKTRLP